VSPGARTDGLFRGEFGSLSPSGSLPAPPSPIPAAALTLPVLLALGMDVTRYLLKYLTPREQRTLLNTSRQLAKMKPHLLFWKLTYYQCRIFYKQPSFRSQLETLVHDLSQ
jgi:hypothetical protein